MAIESETPEEAYQRGVIDALESVAKTYADEIPKIREVCPHTIAHCNKYRRTVWFWKQQIVRLKRKWNKK